MKLISYRAPMLLHGTDIKGIAESFCVGPLCTYSMYIRRSSKSCYFNGCLNPINYYRRSKE